ncbi:hypothetical protein APSETT445_008940 [Aspergillus pseudonomiae]
MSKLIGGGVVVAEEEVAFTAHDYKTVAVGRGEDVRVVDGVEQTLQTFVIFGCFGVASGRDDADFAALLEETDEAGYNGVVVGEASAVIVKGDISVEGHQIEAGGAKEAQELRRVEDEADVIEGRGNKATPADEALTVLVLEGVFEGEGEERSTMIAHEVLNIPEDLRIALMGIGRNGDEVLAVLLVDSSRLRMQDEWNRQKALDPFYQLVATMRLAELASWTAEPVCVIP